MDQSKKNTRKLNIGNIMLNYIDLKITFLLYKSFKLLHLKIHVFDMVDCWKVIVCTILYVYKRVVRGTQGFIFF